MKNKDKQNIVNLNIGKNRVFPYLLTILVSLMFLVVCATAYCGYMVDVLNDYKNDDYNSISEISATTLASNIDKECQAIEDYSQELSNFDYSMVNTYLVRSYLENLLNYNEYSNIYIMNTTGKGFNYLNEKVDVSNQAFYQSIDTSEQAIAYQDEKIIYTTPVIDDQGTLKFYIVAEMSSEFGSKKLLLENWNNIGYYILDGNDNIIAYSKGDKPMVTYQQLIDYGLLYGSDSVFTVDKIDFKNFFQAIKNVLFRKQQYPVVWYQHPLEINDWSILIGRSIPSTDKTIDLVMSLSVTLLSVLIVTQILIMLLFLIMNFINRKHLTKVLFLDNITGGNNWLKFKYDATEELQKGRSRYALVSFDIYQFRVFSDLNGHKSGNEALVQIDALMKKFVKRKEYYAHNTADVFDMLLLYDNNENMYNRLKKFSDTLHQSEILSNMRFAFGVYVIDNKNTSINRLSTMANICKDNDKLKDVTLKETISFFTPKMHEQIIKEREIYNSFSRAIKNREFLLYVQPKYDLNSEVLSAGEALVRWRNQNGKIISPADFIPIFEMNGCIRELDQYMLDYVCKKQREWLDSGMDIVPISVNLSRASFSSKTLVKDIVRLVDSYRVPHDKIEIELTESAFFDNKEVLIDTVKKLKTFGFPISMDDFGAGYSSLNSLSELPIDIVKLDGGFFKPNPNQTEEDLQRGKIIVGNTIKLASDLNLRIVAEGVEYQYQIDFLRSLGYDILIQGFYFSKPIPNDDFFKLLSNESSKQTN